MREEERKIKEEEAKKEQDQHTAFREGMDGIVLRSVFRRRKKSSAKKLKGVGDSLTSNFRSKFQSNVAVRLVVARSGSRRLHGDVL